jgi:hypothetical protein
MGFNTSQQAYGLNTGSTPTGGIWIDSRDPNSSDIGNPWPLGQLWLNNANTHLWYLNNFTSTGGYVQANWIVISVATGIIEEVNVQSGISPVVPVSNAITINGDVALAGTNPVQTVGTSTGVMAVEVQTAQAIASTDATKIGLAAFNSSDFTVDANGFVSATSSANITITGDSGGPLSGSSFTFTGGSTGLTFAGSGTTETLTGIVALTNGGTGANIPSFTDGQLIIGSSSGPAAAANIISSNSTVTITNGANSLDLAVPAGGGLTLGAFGSTPNADGLSLSAGVLNMQPADATHGGGLSTVAQTLAGVKTFSASPILPLTGILIGNGASAVTADSVLPVTFGGTGLATLTTHSVMIGEATANISFADPTTFVTGNPLVSQGGGSDPAFSTTATVNQITIINAPVNPDDGTNKNYVDLLAAGFTIKAAAEAATTANLTATYANGTAGVGATLTNSGSQAAFAVDGYTARVNDRILVKNQATQAQNGIYSVTTLGSGATNWVLTRTTDYDTIAEIIPGSMVPVINGSVNAGTWWVENNTVTVIGTDPIAFNEFGVNASQFLQKANNLSDVASAATSRANLGLTNVAIQNVTQHAVLVGGAANAITSVGAVATTGQILQANTGADPTYSTAAYPSTVAANQILYASANNTVSALATVNNAALTTNATGVPTWDALTDGQVIIGSSSGKPIAANLTAGPGIAITNAANSTTISATGTTTLTVTPVNFAASPYTVLGTDEFLAVQSSGGAITIRLPNAPATGRVYTIKDSTGNASTNNISVTTVGGVVLIDAAATYIMSSNYQAINVNFTGAAYSVY